ncbi:MAG: PadR family transcriptional regulator [Gemmatimonadota bacterium]|nr:MAG: PadR family transcriptional regulator [Gemmatimonadota bacterium]
MGRRSQHGVKLHWFHILLALADQDRHGNGIVREVLERTGGQLKIWPVMLYRCLDQMMEQGLLSELTESDDRPPGESERRRYFRITDKGLGLLAEETERLSGLVEVARNKLIPDRIATK